MIVETHRPEEVIAEALSDLPAMWNKMKDPLKRLRHRAKVDKRLLGVPQLFPYRSPQGNNWLVAVMVGKKVLSIAPSYGTAAATACTAPRGWWRTGCATTSATMCWSATSNASTRRRTVCNG